MTKKWFRRFSGFLVAVMLLSLFPITASAVSKIVLPDGSAAPATVLAGQTYALKVSDNSQVNFYSSNESIAKIGKATGILEPIAPGKVTITAKDAKTDAVVATRTFTVLQRAAAVSISAETLYLSQGDTYSLNPVLTPATSTDVIRFTSGDKSIATVGQTSGTVTAKALGETTITIYAKEKATVSNADPENRTATVRVVVREKPLKAEVLNGNQIKLTFSEDIPGVAAGNFSVTQANTMGVSKTLGIESVAQNSSRELLLTMAEPVFSETETSMATLYFTSPDDENHTIVVDLGKKYADTSEPKNVTSSGKTSIEAGTSGFLQFFGTDKNGASYPLDSVTVNLYSYVTNNWTVLTETTTLDKVEFSQKLLGDGSLMVTYTASPDAAAGTTFAVQLKKENGSSFPSQSLQVNSAGQNAKYSLRFVSSEGEELFDPLTLSAGTFFTPPTPAREGYTFKEWNRSDGEEDVIPGRVQMPEHDLTLTAVWEYTPAELTASVSTDGWIYGSPASPTLNNRPEDANKVTYQYKAVLADDTEWNEAIPADAGNYQVRAVIEDAEGNTITTAVVYFTIRQKEVTIIDTAIAPSKVYDGSSTAQITDNGTLNGVIDGDDVTILPGTAAYNDETVGTGKTVTFSDFALDGADEDNYVLAAQPDPVTADITEPVREVFVEISWDDMSFTYTEGSKGTWNPQTHTYENSTEGGWTADGGNITVTNNGSEAVAAKFAYTPAQGFSEITGSFSKSLLSLEPEKQGSTKLTLSGKPTEEFENKELGTVTVTVGRATLISTAEELLATANKTGVFVLTDGINLEDLRLDITSSDYTLDLSGHGLISSDYTTVTVHNGAALTLMNGTVHNSNMQGYGYALDNYGNTMVENCEIVGRGSSYAITNGGILSIKDSEISGSNSYGETLLHSNQYYTEGKNIVLTLSGNISMSGKIRVSQAFDYPAPTVNILPGTYSFDVTEYVDADLYTVTENEETGIWTVAAK